MLHLRINSYETEATGLRGESPAKSRSYIHGSQQIWTNPVVPTQSVEDFRNKFS
jgi:hypothetical protein